MTRAAEAAELILLVFVLLMLIFAGLCMWLEDHAPERDEDEELRSYYEQFRRLPL